MKNFDNEHTRDYYSGWIYLGSANGRDYYLQSLPNEELPYPSYSIVYGHKEQDYVSTTIGVYEILDNNVLAAKIQLYAEYKSSSYMLHLIAFIREHFQNEVSKGNYTYG